MAINLARTTCRAPGPNNRRRRRKQRENSAKFLPTLARLILLGVGVSDQAHLLSFLFRSGFPFSHLGGQCLPFHAAQGEGEGGREAKTNLHSWVCIRWMSEGGRRREERRGEAAGKRARRGEEWRRRGDEAAAAAEGATEKREGRREGNARIEATRPWQQRQQQLLYGVFMLSAFPRSLAHITRRQFTNERRKKATARKCGDPVGERRKRGPLKAGM